MGEANANGMEALQTALAALTQNVAQMAGMHNAPASRSLGGAVISYPESRTCLDNGGDVEAHLDYVHAMVMGSDSCKDAQGHLLTDHSSPYMAVLLQSLESGLRREAKQLDGATADEQLRVDEFRIPDDERPEEQRVFVKFSQANGSWGWSGS